jgi:hypothetical protein
MLNDGMLRFWWECQDGLPANLIFQVHDAVLIQYRMEHEAHVLTRVKSCLEAHLAGTDFFIPSDVAVGWNFSKEGKENPYGLKKWKGADDRKPPPWVLSKAAQNTALAEDFLNSTL